MFWSCYIHHQYLWCSWFWLHPINLKWNETGTFQIGEKKCEKWVSEIHILPRTYLNNTPSLLNHCIMKYHWQKYKEKEKIRRAKRGRREKKIWAERSRKERKKRIPYSSVFLLYFCAMTLPGNVLVSNLERRGNFHCQKKDYRRLLE